MAVDELLVSSIGTGGETGYSTTTYSLKGVGTCETNLCPLALVDLLDIDTAFVPRTEEATAYDETLGDGFDELNVAYELEIIPKITDQNDANVVLDILLTHIREIKPSSVVLDITHAYRSLPMVMFSSIIYLDALNEVDFDGIYYGEYQGDESPLIDLTYLHTLMEWHHALRAFETTGSLRAIQQLFDSRKRQLFERGEQPHDFAEVVRSLGGASGYFDSGLPLEAGLATRNTINALTEIDEEQFVGPEGGFLAPLTDELRGFELRQEASNKDEIALDMDELSRQQAFVEFYRDTKRYWLALECARELFINRLLYENDDHDNRNWLALETREEARERIPDSTNREDRHSEAEATKLWDSIGQYRNMYAHAGFKQNEAPSETNVKRVLTKLCENISNDGFWEEIA